MDSNRLSISSSFPSFPGYWIIHPKNSFSFNSFKLPNTNSILSGLALVDSTAKVCGNILEST